MLLLFQIWMITVASDLDFLPPFNPPTPHPPTPLPNQFSTREPAWSFGKRWLHLVSSLLKTHQGPPLTLGIRFSSLARSPVLSHNVDSVTLVTLEFVWSFILRRLSPLSHAALSRDQSINPVHPSDLILVITLSAFKHMTLRAPCSSHCSWCLTSICVTDGQVNP